MNAQLKHELDCMERGSQKFYDQQDKLRERGLVDQTMGAGRLMKHSLQAIAEVLETMSNRKTRGVSAQYNRIVKRAAQRVNSKGEVYEDWLAVAFIGLQVLIQSQGPEQKRKVREVALAISTRLEADLKCRMFEAEHPAYYNAVMQGFTDNMTDSYRHKHRILMLKFNEFELEWEEWCNVTRIQVGVRVLHACMEVLDDVFFTQVIYSRGKNHRVIDTTVEGDEWFAEVERNAGAVAPLFEPCVEKPLDWYKAADGRIQGGYHHPKMQNMLPFIKTWDKDHKKYIAEHNPEAHISAINKMQATAWDINPTVRAVQKRAFELGLGIGLPSATSKDIPTFPEHLNKPREEYTEDEMAQLGAWKGIAKHIHTENKINKGKALAYKAIGDMADKYMGRPFHFVYNCDFRGRIYCATPGLSPQGSDIAKGLLRFHRGVPLGESGVRWLAIHMANVYGNDKISYDERVQWVRDNEEACRLAAEDPLGNREWWANADKPWQFLAALIEWKESDYGRNPNYCGKLPIGLDGSCNGLQHYSAMLRDPSGAKATNLGNSLRPEDIYGEVARVCTSKLHRLSLTNAELWRKVGITRKCAKRPVMTLPYGSTQQSCRQYIYEYCMDNEDAFGVSKEKLWELAKDLTPLMWEAIGEVVVAAREAMAWLQGLTGRIITNTNAPIVWKTPIGFPVYQRYIRYDTVTVRTALCGGLRLNVGGTATGVDKYSQRLGIAPNFVHSIDSTHMVMTINETDGWDLAMIHDDFGTHAGHTQELYHKIRETFVDLYENHAPLDDWWEQQDGVESTAPKPQIGDFNIREVLGSTYFFG